MGVRGQDIWSGLHRQTEEPQKTRLRGIFANVDAVTRRKVR